ncbi:MAG: response regulator [Nanoarchaeota archaeon]
MVKVLYVDDDKSGSESIVLCLENAGHEIITAYGGKEGLETLLKVPGIQVIISDYKMPEMDGGDFVKAVRSNPAYNSIPIIGVSSDFPNETKAILTAHFDKPVMYTILDKEIKKLAGQ